MRLLLTGGGTAGHINPALYIAKYFQDLDEKTEILFIGNTDKMEARIVPEAGFAFKGIKTTGFIRSITPSAISKNIKAGLQQIQGKKEAKKYIQEFAPDVVFATGGYISVPVIRAAFSLGIPVVIHESNSFPGLATKVLARKAKIVLCVDEAARKRMPQNVKTSVTGNPINPAIMNIERKEAREKLGLLENDVCILSFGGSLGAETINKIIPQVMKATENDENIKHIHAYGSIYKPYFDDYLREAQVDKTSKKLDIREYISDMPLCLSASDIIISRSGAITVGEICALGRASVLIPSPNVTENHQYHNAKAISDVGGAYVIEEKNLKLDELIQKVMYLAGNTQAREEMAKNSRKHAVLDANKRIADQILAVL